MADDHATVDAMLDVNGTSSPLMQPSANAVAETGSDGESCRARSWPVLLLFTVVVVAIGMIETPSIH